MFRMLRGVTVVVWFGCERGEERRSVFTWSSTGDARGLRNFISTNRRHRDIRQFWLHVCSGKLQTFRNYVQAWVWRTEKGGTAWKRGYGIIIVFNIVTVGISIVVIVVVFHSADVDIAADVVTALGVVAVLLLLL